MLNIPQPRYTFTMLILLNVNCCFADIRWNFECGNSAMTIPFVNDMIYSYIRLTLHLLLMVFTHIGVALYIFLIKKIVA